MNTSPRIQSGVPSGGQFAASGRAEPKVALAPTRVTGTSNNVLASRLDALMADHGTSPEVGAEDGYFPGTIRLTGPYEGELVDLAEKCAHDGLYVDLKDGYDVYGGDGDSFEFTVAEHDRYGDHNTWSTGEDIP